MVTKRLNGERLPRMGFVLAKKLMVTKLHQKEEKDLDGFVLAKKLMVTKHKGLRFIIACKFCSSEKINGNKTN